VIAGRTPGIDLQFGDGVGGVFVDDNDSCADQIVDLVRDRSRAEELGRRGRARIGTYFLMPRLLLNELQLIHSLVSSGDHADLGLPRDPVCGMVLPAVAATQSWQDKQWTFCSQRCSSLFTADPSRYQTML
jgi:YHS domain-containing protein